VTAPNAELAYKVLDQIDAYPDRWKQGLYIGEAKCGTVGCFAGWAVLLSGAKPVYDAYSGGQTDIVEVDGQKLMVREYAEELLGASRYIDEYMEDEEDLFDGSNSREDLGRLVAEIFGPRPEHCGYTLAHPAHGWTRLANDEHPDDQPARCPGAAEERAS
jgi:hypothetical protein